MIFKAPFSWTIGDKAITYPDCSHNSSLIPATSLELPCALGEEGFMGSCKDLNSYSVLKTCNIAGNC